MEPMYLCDECFKRYKEQSQINGSVEEQKSTHCDECGKKDNKLTFPMYWIIPSWELEFYTKGKEDG